MALAKKNRLNKNEVSQVFKKGKTVRYSFLFVKFLKNNLNHLRLAAIVPTKVYKKATERNKIRRLINAVIGSGQFLEKSYDVVITATPSILEKQVKEIKRETEQTINSFFVQNLVH